MKALEHGGARVSRLDATRRKRRRQHRQQSNGIRRRSAAGMRSGRPAALSLRQRQRPLTMKPARVETCLGTSMGECARTFCSRLVGAASTTSSTLRRAGQLDANSTLRQQVWSLRGRRGLHASSGCAPRGSVTSQIETSKSPHSEPRRDVRFRFSSMAKPCRALHVALLRSVHAVGGGTGSQPTCTVRAALVSIACSALKQRGRGSQLEVWRLAGSSSHAMASLILNRILYATSLCSIKYISDHLN